MSRLVRAFPGIRYAKSRRVVAWVIDQVKACSVCLLRGSWFLQNDYGTLNAVEWEYSRQNFLQLHSILYNLLPLFRGETEEVCRSISSISDFLRSHIMTIARATNLGLALLLATTLSGCLGSTGGSSNSSSAPANGGGATGDTNGGNAGDQPPSKNTTDLTSDYDANFDDVLSLVPTSNMPTSIQATYMGQMKATITGSSEVLGEVVADLNLGVDWTDGQSSNPFTGGASNFQGRLTGGEFEDISGELSVDTSLPGTITRLDTPAGNIAGFNVPATQTGAMLVHLSGDLTQDGSTADTTIQLGGNFFGDGARAAAGAVSGGFKDIEAGSPAIFDGGIGGTYYLETQ